MICAKQPVEIYGSVAWLFIMSVIYLDADVFVLLDVFVINLPSDRRCRPTGDGHRYVDCITNSK